MSRPCSLAGEGGGSGATAASRRLRGIPEAEQGREGEQCRQGVGLIREAALPVDQEGLHAERPRTLDVVEQRVADHGRSARLDAEQLEGRAEDRRTGLHLPVDAGRDPGVHVELEVADERVEIAARVRDETDRHAARAEVVEDGQGVLVELEVLGVEPALGDRLGHLADPRPLAAHAAHDVLREANPDLLVVLELGMVAQVLDGGDARLGIARGIEGQPVALARSPVAVGPEQRPRLDEREVDVEENRFDAMTLGYTSAGHVYAAGWRLASEGSARRTRSMWARSSSAETTASSSGACASTTPHGSTIIVRPYEALPWACTPHWFAAAT